jgi:formate dehydrogenase subunit beta
MENELRSIVKELIVSSKVKQAIGYEEGSIPSLTTPCFTDTADDADRFVWNPACVNNLCTYLPQAVNDSKTAVVVKPCDGKSIAELIRENQITRDDIVVISVGCPGVININALKEIGFSNINKLEWGDDSIIVSTENDKVSIPFTEALLPKCASCEITESPIYDIKVGESPQRSPSACPYKTVDELEALSSEERIAYWAKQFEKCIRCYGCRQVCPMCYCKECFTDKNGQIWASKATSIEANWFYHMGRAMHMAGRCIGCGECDRSCPVNIPMSIMYKMLHRDAAAMFGRIPGTDPELLPIFGSFEEKDPDPCPE